MDSIAIQKRLIGKQDINFDTTGENESADFVANGVVKPLSKLNASHIPILKPLRERLSGASDVNGGLQKLSEQIENLTDFQFMTADTVIDIEATATISQIQVLIDAQIRNLGGNTLTFNFPASINQSLVNALSWRGFNNGKLVIAGSGITVSDVANINSLFAFTDCTCKVEVREFTFQHTLSPYGVSAERCPGIYLFDCNFIGSSFIETYAVFFSLSDGSMSNCTFTDDEEWKIVSSIYDAAKEEADKSLGESEKAEAKADVMLSPERYMVQNGVRILKVKKGTAIYCEVDGEFRYFRASADTDVDVENALDTGNYLLPGKDYCVYLADDSSGGLKFVVSQNSTYPDGFTADNSRKIGGFHTLCAAAGTISGHPLSGYAAGDILPASVWCLNHRPFSAPGGMVYIDEVDMWVDVYNASGPIAAPESVFGGTRIHSQSWYAFREGFYAVKKRMPDATVFSAAMEGSNQKTNITGSTLPSPDTTGGHWDTTTRRMISKYGCEEGCGLQWQWLDELCANPGSAGWVNVTGPDGVAGSKGNAYGSAYAIYAGGHWTTGVNAGSRCIFANAPEAWRGTNENGGRGCSHNRRI